MQKQAEKFGAEVTYGSVQSVDFSTRPLKLMLDDGSTLKTKSVIISTGMISSGGDDGGDGDVGGTCN